MDNHSKLLTDLFKRRGKPHPKPLDHFLVFSSRSKELNEYIAGEIPFIHIAGTNGKGSVAHKCLKGLREEGLNVGLFQSPHLFRINERIISNESEIPDEFLYPHLEEILKKDTGKELHYFEIFLLVALEYFLDIQADIVIFECGLGGKLDPTNMIHPAVTVITQIGLDHMEFLGSDRTSIAKEKAGILKEGVPIVLGPQAKGIGIEEYAREKKAPLYLVEERIDYNLENSACASKVLELLIPSSKIREVGLYLKEPLGRYQEQDLMIRGQNLRIIWDVAHNVSALEALINRLEKKYLIKDLMIVFAMSSFKDFEGAQALFRDYGIDAVHLKGIFQKKSGFSESQKIGSTLETEFNYILRESHEKTLVVTGSFLILSRLQQVLRI